MKFFIIAFFNFVSFSWGQTFGLSYDLMAPYEEGAHTIGCSNPSSIRLSFTAKQDLRGFLNSEGIDYIVLSLGTKTINISASAFVKTSRASVCENFPIFQEFETKCSFVGKIQNIKLAGGLYKKHTAPSGDVVYDLNNPLEAIRFVFELSDGKLNITPGYKYVQGDQLVFSQVSFGESNPYPSWYESFYYHGKGLMFMDHCGCEKMHESEKMLDLGYLEQGREGLLEVAMSHNVYLWHRFQAVDILSKKFPQEYSNLKEDIILGVFDAADVSVSYKIEAALEYAKIKPEQGYGYLENMGMREDVRPFDRLHIASELAKEGKNDYVKQMLEGMLTQDSISSKDQLIIIEKLNTLGLIR